MILCLCLSLTACASDNYITDVPTSDTHSQGAATDNTDKKEPTSQLKIIFGDVGKADFILLCCDGEYAVIDTGYKKNFDYVEQVLNDNGVQNIKFAVGTHPDKDHIGGMVKLMKNFNVQQLYISPLETSDNLYEKMIEHASENDIPTVTAKPGDVLTLGGATLTTYAPTDELVALNDENEASVVQMLNYKDFSMLLMGDGQFVCESVLLSSGYTLSADVLKVAHHGSNKASSLQLLQAVGAKYAVISTASEDGDELPSSGVIDTLKALNTEIYRTDRDGGIILTTDGSNIEFEKGYGLQWTN